MADTPGRDLLHAPLGDIIRDVAMSIADAQVGLDAASTRTAEFMSGKVVLRDPQTGGLVDAEGHPSDVPVVASSAVMFGHDINPEGQRIPRMVSMMELGFVPTFYQFVDTTIEMKLSVRLTGAGQDHARVTAQGVSWGQGERSMTVHASTVDAGFASSYGYSAELATKVSTKIVPIPPPPALAAQIERLLVDERLDVNTATVGELEALAALGPDLAEAVVEDREANGPFGSVDDLLRVKGVGPVTLQRLRGSIQV